MAATKGFQAEIDAFLYGNVNNRWNIGVADTVVIRNGKIAPMSKIGVKIIVAIAFCLSVFDRKPREPDVDTEKEFVENPDAPQKSHKRLAVRLDPDRRSAGAAGGLGIA